MNRREFTAFPVLKIIILITAQLICAVFSGCQPRPTPLAENEIPPSAHSLLLDTPVYSENDTVPDPFPAPERVNIKDFNVNSWRIPPDNPTLRFPIDMHDKAHLSFRLGGKTMVSIHIGDLSMRIEYVPETLPSDFANEDEENPIVIGEPVTIWQATPIDHPTIFSEWYFVDIALSRFSPGKGELRFILDGPLSTDPGMFIYFGQPTVYFPDEVANKNILWIGVDTLRADSLSTYGARSIVTPELTDLASEGVQFDQARSQAPWTLPSFASMLTGRLPSEAGSTIYSGYMPQRNITISEILMEKGYTTSIICANLWLGNEQSGFEQGFEEMWFVNNALAAESAEPVKNFIARSTGRDWFCFYHLMDPHIPYTPPMEFVEKLVDPTYEGDITHEFIEVESWKRSDIPPPPEDIQRARELYDGEAASLDFTLGEIFDYLDETGQRENTLIIFSSDHGEEFFDHRDFEHGHTQYDELVRMPLIIDGGEFTGGLVIDDSVGNTDLFPTILDYLGLPLTENIAGIPLQTYLTGDVPDSRIIYGEDNSRGTHRKFCVRWPYKCILDYVTAEIRLYNLEDDPGELNNIYEEERDTGDLLANAIELRMRPEESAFHVWISRSANEQSQSFSGTLRLPGGFKMVDSFMLEDSDSVEADGDTVTFTIKSAIDFLGPNKHIIVVPNDENAELEVSLRVNGVIAESGRFYPYGNFTEEPLGRANVNLGDYSAGINLPPQIHEMPAACYIWGVKGYSGDESAVDLDPETIESLRAIGYFSD